MEIGDIVEYNQMNETVLAYLSAADEAYTDDNYASVSVASDYAGLMADDSVGYDLKITSAGTIYFQDETDGQFSWSDTVTAGTYTVYDLIPGHLYCWYVSDTDDTITQMGRIRATGFLRMIYDSNSAADESDNCRDFGGWDCDGGTVRYGILYRGEDPVMLTADTKSRMQDRLRIKYQVDLYAAGGTAKLWSDILYDEYPLSDSSIADDYEIGGTYYDTFVACVKQVMDNASKGVTTYFHCWAGADRTGLLAWLLHILLGVSEADADKDYELTNLSARTGRYRGTSSYGTRVNYFADMGDTLFDGMIYWCARAGISAALINNFRAAMIDGSPATVAYDNLISSTLAMCSLSNAATKVANGGSYSATLTADNDAAIVSVAVTMGGVDITADCYDSDSGTISIDEVTGDIVITVVAVSTSVLVAVTYSLSNVVSSNTATSAIAGYSYETTLSLTTAADGYSVGNVTVVMDGEDVTSTCYNSATGVVSITEVTGDITITAEKVGYTNLLPTGVTFASESSTAEPYILDDIGYREGMYCSTTNIITYSSDSSFFATGLMPIYISPDGIDNSKAIYIKGFTLTSASHTRLQFARNLVTGGGGTTIYNAGQLQGASGTYSITDFFDIEELDADSQYYKLTLKLDGDDISLLYSNGNFSSGTYCRGFRLSAPIPSGGMDNVVITVDEEII